KNRLPHLKNIHFVKKTASILHIPTKLNFRRTEYLNPNGHLYGYSRENKGHLSPMKTVFITTTTVFISTMTGFVGMTDHPEILRGKNRILV
ncbi:hypothetical protein, partial [Parabacteroides johnsonii]